MKNFMNIFFTTMAILGSIAGYSQNGLVGINTTTPSTTFDVNGGTRVRSLVDATANTTYTRNVVADVNGNLGYTNRVAKATPPNVILSNYIITDTPIIVATGVSLTEFTPIITSFLANAANVGLPTYSFYDSGGNIFFDMLNPATGTGYNITIKFIRNN